MHYRAVIKIILSVTFAFLAGNFLISHPSAQELDKPSAPIDPKRVIAQILGSTEDVWHKILPEQAKRNYENPKLVLFSERINSRCGSIGGENRYCHADRTIYLDLNVLRNENLEYHGNDTTAYAYVVAHFVGHHVEALLGILPNVLQAQERSTPDSARKLAERVELMADCLAGVWAGQITADKSDHRSLDGLWKVIKVSPPTANDRLTGGHFVYSTGELRQKWITTGFKSGDLRACNTFQD